MGEDRKPFDEAFKSLSEADPRGFLEVMGILAPGVEAEVELLPQEISRAVVVLDTGLIVRPRGQPPFIAVFEAFAKFAPNLKQVAEYNKGLGSNAVARPSRPGGSRWTRRATVTSSTCTGSVPGRPKLRCCSSRASRSLTLGRPCATWRSTALWRVYDIVAMRN